MAKQTINLGTGELTGDGESIRSAFDKINENFDELYAKDATDVVLSAINENIVPTTDNTYDLGAPDKQWRSLYVSSDTIFIGGVSLKIDGENRLIVGDDSTILGGAVSYNDLTNTPTIPTDLSDLTDTQGLLGQGGGAGTGDITFSNSTISAGSNDEVIVQARDANSFATARLNLEPEYSTAKLSAFSSESVNTYTLANGDFATGVWQDNGFGNGVVTFSGAQNIGDFFQNTLQGLNPDNVTITINSEPSFTWNGGTSGSGTSTPGFGTNPIVPASPITITSISFSYRQESYISVNYDNQEIRLDAQNAGIRIDATSGIQMYGDSEIDLQADAYLRLSASENIDISTGSSYSVNISTGDFSVSAFDDINIRGNDSFRLRNESPTAPIRIITDDDNNEYTWAFNADGTLTFPDATVQTTAYTGPQTTLDGDVTGSVFADDSTLLVDGVNGIVPTSESAKSVTQIIDTNTAVNTSENLTTDDIFVSPFDFVADLDPDLGFVIDGLSQRNETEIEVNLFVAGGEFFQTYLLGLALGRTVIVTYSTGSGNQTFTSTISQAFAGISQFDPSTGWARTTGRILGTVPEGYTGLVEINFPVYSIQSHSWTFGSNGDLTAPGDITTGTNDGRFIQDCGDGTTSIRWINVDEGSDSTQLIRAYTGDPKLDTEVERAQIKLNWAGEFDEQSGLTIRSFDQDTDTEYDWDFRGDGDLSLPGGGELAFNDEFGPAGRIIPSVSDGGGLTIQAEQDLEIKINDGEGGSSTWSFEADGSITFPDSTVQTTAYTGSSSGDRLVNGELEVVLGSTGTLTLPDGGAIDILSESINGGAVRWTVEDTTKAEFFLPDGDEGGKLFVLGTDAGVPFLISVNGEDDAKDWAFRTDGILEFPTADIVGETPVFPAIHFPVPESTGGYVGVTPNGLGVVVNDNAWQFNFTGSLSLPSGGVIAEGVVTDNPTIELTPADPDDASQKLIIKGGVATDYHLHLTTGDLTRTSIILGTDEHNVRTDINGAVTISSRNYDELTSKTWDFTPSGEIYLPPSSPDNFFSGQIYAGGGGTGFLNLNVQGFASAEDYGAVRLGNQNEKPVELWAGLNSIFRFDSDGSFTLPGDIKSDNAINIDINLTDSTLRRWTFGEDGILNLPEGGDIVDSTGTSVLGGGGSGSVLEETFEDKTSATGVIEHDATTNRLFRHTSMSANFTANFTNLGLEAGEATSLSLVLVQGATARMCTAVQIGGAAQTILWQGSASAPAGNNNRTDVVTFSVLCTATDTYTVLGMLTSFGG